MAELPEVDPTKEQREMSPEWLKKDTQARLAEAILKGVDPEAQIEIEWVTAEEFQPGVRRIVQLRG